MDKSTVRYDWSLAQVKAIYESPLLELISKASGVHRENFNGNDISGQCKSKKGNFSPLA